MTTAADELLDLLAREPAPTRDRLRALNTTVSRRWRAPLQRCDVLLAAYRRQVRDGGRAPSATLEQVLQLNRTRTVSGVTTVTVLTKPYACPGRCVYCPTQRTAPKSYLDNEPAVLRAIRHRYDPYDQVRGRLDALTNTGHPTQKIELIVKGGTWSFYPEPYQRWFIERCFEAANENGTGSLFSKAPGQNENRYHFHDVSWEPLVAAQRDNETATHRLIGITIETRPDYVTLAEVARLRRLGVTRVEIGVQHLDERVLVLTQRDHTTREIAEATRLLKDAGLKVAYHMMPNLPGSTPALDRWAFEELFANPAYRPDTLKIYPCSVVQEAELYDWWRAGRYAPYTTEELTELLVDLKRAVPPYARIERVIRDIPSTSILAGNTATNLREVVARRMRARGLRCQCIRCREIRDAAHATHLRLARRDYDASGGREVFLSWEDADDRLYALLRLRRTATNQARVRELHTYGPSLAVDDHAPQATQHRGLGRALLAEAERVAREEWRYARITVTSGVGVRVYYRRLGYVLDGADMVKRISVPGTERVQCILTSASTVAVS